jgi:hypothetical protein
VHTPARRPFALLICLLSAAAGSASAALAVDREGNVYAVIAADIRMWDSRGNPVPEARFPIRDGAPYALCVDEEYLYCAVSGREPSDHRQQIRRFRLKDGRPAPFTGQDSSDPLAAGHIQAYGRSELPIPGTAPESERHLMRQPLRSLDVAGSTLYVADALGGAVRLYDTDTGAAKGHFPARLPRALAVDPIGQVWVADHQGALRAYRTDGYAGVTYAGLGDPTAMSFGPGARLYIADARTGQVLTLNSSPDRPGDFTPVLGHQGDRLDGLRSAAADASGNLVTLQIRPDAAGARLARWSPAGKLLWERQVMRVRLAWYTIYDFDLPMINGQPARP